MAKNKINGQCNICGETGPLTYDHVPPKGVAIPTQMRIDHIVRWIGGDREDGNQQQRPVFRSQNGVKFPTLCGRCNSTLLGTRYDPALIEFVNGIDQFFRQPAGGIIPRVVDISGRPHRIMRSVLGHLCALSRDRYLKGKHTELVRDYLLDETKDFPEPLRFYYWIYPDAQQILIRDFVYMQFGEPEPVMAWLMKFFPIAFMITWDEKPDDRRFVMNEMTPWRGYGNIDTSVGIPINVTQKIHPMWPECPDDNGMSAYGESAFVATQY